MGLTFLFSELYDKIQAGFELLPICALVQDKVMVIHGGLFSSDVTIADIEKYSTLLNSPAWQCCANAWMNAGSIACVRFRYQRRHRWT
jgi:hypothetical protein